MREPAFWYRRPSWLSLLLAPLGALYGLIAGYRLLREGIDAGVPVLCVGNYHVGGAGKTPTVLALTKLLRGLGETPVVLSRGYGGRLRGPIKVDPARHAAIDRSRAAGSASNWPSCFTSASSVSARLAPPALSSAS